jgi:hypothetical protein
MASFAGIAAAGKSVERFLNLAFDELKPVENATTKAVLIRTNDFDLEPNKTVITPPALSVFFYRVDFNKTMRAAWSAVGSQDGRGHLALDIHFLITAWAENAEDELRILGRAMQSFETMPILSGPLLHPRGEWAPNESVQVIMEEISTEAVMRTFDSLTADYRLSVPYIARIVRLDSRIPQPDVPVTTLALRSPANALP